MKANSYLIGDALIAHQISRRNNQLGFTSDPPSAWPSVTLWIAAAVCVWLLYVVAQLP